MYSAILLAAGESKRMKGENKLIKLINGKPLIEYSVNNILKSCIDELIIVTGYQNKLIENSIDKNKKIKFFLNKHYKSGMSSSNKKGINNLSKQTKFFFICLGDMPLINKEIYNKLIKQSQKNEIVVPTYKNQSGNPVLFSMSMKNKIMNIKGDIGAKEILKKNKEKILNLEIGDQSIFKNFNTNKDFII